MHPGNLLLQELLETQMMMDHWPPSPPMDLREGGRTEHGILHFLMQDRVLMLSANKYLTAETRRVYDRQLDKYGFGVLKNQ